MDRKKACAEIMTSFIKVVNKYNALEKIPVRYGMKQNLYHSERHMVDHIGDHVGMNVTELADAAGVTKGAMSQVLKKLESKEVTRRYNKSTNEKEVFVELTKLGKEIYKEHKQINEESILPLYVELEKYSDDKVEFFIEILHWIDGFLEDSKAKMKAHSNRGH